MCTVSDKLKLCTCKSIAVNNKHYWVLFRFVKGKDEIIMGLPLMPADINPETDMVNQEILLSLLNAGNAFDEPLYPVNKDRLQISFGMKDSSRLDYGFIYKKNSWEPIEFDYFGWFYNHDEIKQGKIKSALKFKKYTVNK